jgi:hypothetical protein
MMTSKFVLALAFVTFSAPVAHADQRAVSRHAPGPCQQIAETCKAAGFAKGDWKDGDGLWRDCINPVFQGVTAVPGATKPLPAVDPSVVTACRAKYPTFGAGKVGSN